MFAAKWRDVRSALSGVVVRLAGFAVIFALLGMFVQMVSVAYPILSKSSLTEMEFSPAVGVTDTPVVDSVIDSEPDFNGSQVVLVSGKWRLYGKSGEQWTWVNDATGLPIESSGLPRAWVKATAVGRNRGLILLTEDGFIQQHDYLAPKFEGGVPSTKLIEQVSVVNEVVSLDGHPRLSVVAVAGTDQVIQLFDFRNPETPILRPIGFDPIELYWASPTQLVVVGSQERRTFEFKTTDIGGAWDRLISPVQYKGYEEPNYLWLPLPASEEAEPKFSLVPLLFGTFKAAMLALIFAVPLSIGAAIYVGFFMSEPQRDRIRPVIDMLTAFPTVVLGAIGLFWIAPIFEHVISALLGVILLFPLMTVIGVFLLRSARLSWVRLDVLDDWPLKLLPLVFVIVFVSGWMGTWASSFLPGGSIGMFLEIRGVALNYFNSLLVGLILALAITPTIFSVAEEAIHSVPRNLSSGALALGSTPWQSYRDIVLPLAMPGVIAAIMIGFGRAAGETMILLMLSGNTGVIDLSIFEGLRSVSASLALELPEAPRNSTHYYALFVMGLLLFASTFAINTAAEVIKERVKARTQGA